MEMLGRVVQPEKFSRWLAVSLVLFAASVASGQAQFGITTKGLPDGVVGQSYSATVTASGGTIPYNWEVGTLPPGLRSAVSRDILTISGVPERAVELSVKITVTDSGRIPLTDSQPFTIIISPPPLAITTSSSLPEGTVGTPYSETLQATGGTGSFSWDFEGSLPPGLTLNSRGVISGTPTRTGTFSFTVLVQDDARATDSRNLSISILSAPLAVSTSLLPNGTVGTAYSQTLRATGGAPPYSWIVTDASLPPRLVLDSSTGKIGGIPTTPDVYRFTVQVVDSQRATASKALSITVNFAAPHHKRLYAARRGGWGQLF